MSTPQQLQINRGVELLLRRKTKPIPPKAFKLKFAKMISLLKREIHIYFEFSFDIKKSISRR
jgi:hypothetical protein